MMNKSKNILIFGIIPFGFILLGIYIMNNFNENSLNKQNIELDFQNTTKSIVPLEQIVSGGPSPDGIPSIDNPKFIPVDQADKFLSNSDLIVGIDVNGEIRGYPLQILVWHEIVNDNVGGVPIAITYCPLCFTNQIFNRTTVDGQVLEFGTSGKLYNSNLVMYDRNTKSLWSQGMAQSIMGKFAGMKLEKIPFDLSYWDDWKTLYPKSKILSQDTGHSRPYGANPYGDYFTNSEILFPISNRDDRLELKDIVIGKEYGGKNKAYPLKDIESSKVINDNLNGKSITLWSEFPFLVKMFDPSINGQVLSFYYEKDKKVFIDKQTGSEWTFDGKSISGPMIGNNLSRLPFDEGFWFEWATFYPETEIYNR